MSTTKDTENGRENCKYSIGSHLELGCSNEKVWDLLTGSRGSRVGGYAVLVGGDETLGTHDPVKTTGSYWPYASTMYDYIYRAMPFGEAQSLTHNETYQIVAFLLYMNDIIADDFDVSHENIGTIKMPNREGFFVPDPRPDGQPASGEPCMAKCDVATNVIGRARDIDVTPESES